MIQKESESRDGQGVTQPFYSMDTQLSTSRTFNLIFTFPSSFFFIHFLTSLFSLAAHGRKSSIIRKSFACVIDPDNKFGSQINEFISDDRLLISFPALSSSSRKKRRRRNYLLAVILFSLKRSSINCEIAKLPRARTRLEKVDASLHVTRACNIIIVLHR